ncbi:lycopene cyclase domain-containing protein [Phycicoccus avicenniae]|uniref:lycopene cyclase domain-containing protein n=1 Tax=Phycicoccus avicenniae TaxID=2828860 RepID=UPI003D2D662D
MPEYTALAVLSVLLTLAAERFWLRTGVLRTARFWAAMGIVAVFQVLVDGWLTKQSAPIVLYDASQTLGVRRPWDIPVEDFLFGFSMVTLTILLWVRAAGREALHDPAGAVADDRDEPAGGDVDDVVLAGVDERRGHEQRIRQDHRADPPRHRGPEEQRDEERRAGVQ